MTKEEEEQNRRLMLRAKIDRMSHIDMARAHRFSPAGDPLFQSEVGAYFAARFKRLGGMTPAMSKLIGLG